MYKTMTHCFSIYWTLLHKTLNPIRFDMVCVLYIREISFLNMVEELNYVVHPSPLCIIHTFCMQCRVTSCLVWSTDIYTCVQCPLLLHIYSTKQKFEVALTLTILLHYIIDWRWMVKVYILLATYICLWNP